MNNHRNATPARGLTRRRVVSAAAWTAPAITVVTAAPSFADYPDHTAPVPGVVPELAAGSYAYTSDGYYRWLGTTEEAQGSHVPGAWAGSVSANRLGVSIGSFPAVAGTGTYTLSIRILDHGGNLFRPALATPSTGGWTFAQASFVVLGGSEYAVDFEFTSSAPTPPAFAASFIGTQITASAADPLVLSAISTQNYASATLTRA